MEKKNDHFIEKNRKQILGIALALILLLGGTYAWLQLSLNGTKTTRIEAGTLALTLNDGVAIHIEDAYPMTDEDGLKTDPYTFTLTNTGDITSEYTIYLDDEVVDQNSGRMNDSVVKYGLTKKEGVSTTALVSTLLDDKNQRILETGTIESKAINTYDLRLWIADFATNQDIHILDEQGNYIDGKTFSVKLRIEATQVKR